MMDVELVVARYCEDVSWVGTLGMAHTIYDKSGDPLSDAVSLPNVGRESHTYLSHILRVYPDFPSYTVFLQGDPFFHLREDGAAGPDDLKSMIERVVERQKPFEGFAWFRMQCDGLGRPHDMALPENKGKWAGWGKNIPLSGVFEKLFAAKAPKSFLVRGATGNFMVARDNILARPRGFYAYALSLLEADPDDANNTGHGFERLWQHIFNGNRTMNRSNY